MHGVARHFFTLAIVYALAGMALGLHMSISQDHSQMPTHAHALAAGWLMSAVVAFFYHLVPAARESRLAIPHFWLSAVSGIAGNAGVEPVVAIASLGFYAAMLLFAVIALPAVWRGGEGAGARPTGVPSLGKI